MFRFRGFSTARQAVVAALAAALCATSGALATATAAAPAAATPAARVSAGPQVAASQDRFADCPSRAELPAGAEPERWRCEVMSATGSLKIGKLRVRLAEPVVVTHAEGRIDGEFHQVFGGLRAAPVPVPGTPLRLTLSYGGSFDFQTNEERLGELALIFGLSDRASLLPRGCAIGSGAEPVRLTLKAVGPSAPGTMPDAEDRAFTAPRTSGCGTLGPLLDHLGGLPAPSGQNRIHLDGDREIRPYTELP